MTIGHKYYLGLNLALCLGDGVQLTQIYIDEELAWSGSSSATTPTSGTINEPELFGGYQGGGGWVGPFTFYPGSFSQSVNSYLESVISVGGVPGYRGQSHIVFENAYIGESNQLRKMAFVLQKYSDELVTTNAGRVGVDMNPMEVLYQLATDPWLGLGVSPSEIDLPNWRLAATTLFNEGNGMSLLVTSSQQAKELFSEVLRQVDAIMFQDPETGLLQIKLIREDYVVADLPLYDEDDVLQIRNFTKTSWEDVVSQIKISFPQRDKESSAVAIAQDGSVAAVIGRLKTAHMSFPFCYSAELANKIASRERSQLSAPLFQATIEMNRNGYGLRPGDVFKLNWSDYGLSELVMRVQKHDLGSLMDNRIVINAIQDQFASKQAVFAPPADSTWTPIVNSPTNIVTWEIIDMPFFFARKVDIPVTERYSAPLAIPQQPQNGSESFSMVGGIVSGTLDINEPDLVNYPATGTLSAAYGREDGQLTGIDAVGFTLNTRQGVFEPGTTSEILQGELGILYVGGEFMGFTAATNDFNTAGISGVYRGLFGSTVKDHALGTRAYQLLPEHFGFGYAGTEVYGDLPGRTNWYYKLLDATAGIQQDPSSVVEATWTPRDELRLPARPRNLTLEGTRAILEVDSLAPRTLTWAATNRVTGLAYPSETAATETPPEATTYNVEVYIGGVLDVSLGVSDTAALSHAIPFGTLSAPVVEADCEVRVYARRDDPDSPGVAADYLSSGYASLSFTCNIVANILLLEGDMQSGTDRLLLEGDMQSGTDKLILEGDEA